MQHKTYMDKDSESRARTGCDSESTRIERDQVGSRGKYGRREASVGGRRVGVVVKGGVEEDEWHVKRVGCRNKPKPNRERKEQTRDEDDGGSGGVFRTSKA